MALVRILRPAAPGTWIALLDGDTVRVRETQEPLAPGDLVDVDVNIDGPGAAGEPLAVRARVDAGRRPEPGTDTLRWATPGPSGVTRGARLWARQRVITAIRAWLHGQHMLEAPAPVLVRGTSPDEWLDSFQVEPGRYLTTSTEYHIKRLLVGGFQRVFTLGPNFRRGDVSPRHNPEFTMLEWGRVGASMADIERDAEELVQTALAAAGRTALTPPKGAAIPCARPFLRISMCEALQVHLGVTVDPAFSIDQLNAAMQHIGSDVGCRDERDRPLAFSVLLDRLSEHLGHDRPTFLVDWPAFPTSSTGTGDQGAVIERSELFIGGLEIADGFPFLRAAADQRRACEAHLQRRHEAGLPAVDLDTRYLEALELGLPPGAGMALGVERLLMVVLGAEDIREVLAFSWGEL